MRLPHILPYGSKAVHIILFSALREVARALSEGASPCSAGSTLHTDTTQALLPPLASQLEFALALGGVTFHFWNLEQPSTEKAEIHPISRMSHAWAIGLRSTPCTLSQSVRSDP